MSAIAARLAQVHADIAAAAARAGRASSDIELIAVSKTQPWPAVAAAIAAGQRRFGENTLQDALTKIPQCPDNNIEWHFIGHLQSNKAKGVAQHFTWIHSLDSVALAHKLARAATRTLNVLIEVNVSGERNKFGVAAAGLEPLMAQLLAANLPHIALRGLMTIGPQTTDERALRSAFAQLRTLRETCARQFNLKDFDQLSMGMSGDFVPAIVEGATLVRIGSAIFGARGKD